MKRGVRNNLIVGLLGLGTVSANAESSLGKEVIFKCQNLGVEDQFSCVVGIVVGEDRENYVVRYVDRLSDESAKQVKEEVVKRQFAGLRVKRLGDEQKIAEGDVIRSFSGGPISIVNLLFSDGSILGSQNGSHVLYNAHEVKKL